MLKQLKDKVSKIVIQMNTFEDEANDIVNAVYAERLIQYGNRYREASYSVDKSLTSKNVYLKNNVISAQLKYQSKHLKV